jgi:hypothetical protein
VSMIYVTKLFDGVETIIEVTKSFSILPCLHH